MFVSLVLVLSPEQIAQLRQAKKTGAQELDDAVKAIILASSNSAADRQTIIDNLGALL